MNCGRICQIGAVKKDSERNAKATPIQSEFLLVLESFEKCIKMAEEGKI
jgi:hypothetical protein